MTGGSVSVSHPSLVYNSTKVPITPAIEETIKLYIHCFSPTKSKTRKITKVDPISIAIEPSTVFLFFTNLCSITLLLSFFPTKAASASPIPHARIPARIIYLYDSPYMPQKTLMAVIKTKKAIVRLLLTSPLKRSASKS